jgi:hypothetical protein
MATRVPNANNQPASSPNISLASAHLALEMTWSTHVTINSDHLPITIALPSGEAPQSNWSRTYTNFRKANWPRFIREVEEMLRACPMPTSCASGEKISRKALLNAAKHWIPSGCRQDFVPGLPREAADKIQQRDKLRRADPYNPEITQLNREISTVILDNRRQIWCKSVESTKCKNDHYKQQALLSPSKSAY